MIVKPNAKHETIIERDGVFELSVKAPPREGRANERARTILAATLALPKSSVALMLGAHSKNKVFTIDGLDRAAVFARLSAAATFV